MEIKQEKQKREQSVRSGKEVLSPGQSGCEKVVNAIRAFDTQGAAAAS